MKFRLGSVVPGAFLLMMGGRILGVALSPMLLAHAPLALLALSPIPANLVVVGALSAPAPYYAIAVPIPIVQCLIGYALGHLEGPRLIDFLVRRGVASEARLHRLLAPVRISAPLLVFALPGPIVCALAGASAASVRVFMPALVASQIVWAFLCRLFGEALLTWIAAARVEIARYALPLTLITTAIAVLLHFRRSRRAG
jgi:hypothetical protein